MLRLLFIVFFTLSLTSPNSPDQSSDQTEFRQALLKSRAASNDLLASLRALLMKQLASGGAVRAIEVCADSAQAIGERIQSRHGLSIRRVSEKWRNSRDIPDEFELRELKRLDAIHARGNLSDTLEVYGIVKEDSVRVFRYMKPIFVNDMCLTCHGSREQMKDLIYSAIRARYPNDKALDYSAGDFRGVVSVKITLHP